MRDKAGRDATCFMNPAPRCVATKPVLSFPVPSASIAEGGEGRMWVLTLA